MKKSTRAISILGGAALLMQVEGCYGNFALTRKLYTWNGTVGDKWLNSIVMWGMMIIPVYSIAGAADFLILNTVQFWTGKNPVAMNSGEKDIQMVQWEGKQYKLTATQNRLDVQLMQDGKAQAPVSLVYDAGTHAWTAASPNASHKIVEMVGESGQIADLIYPDGHKERVNLAQN